MRHLGWPLTRISDEEYIARLRRSMRSWERWRFWLILFHAALLASVMGVFFGAFRVLFRLAQPADVGFQVAGLVLGAIIGIIFGWGIYGILHSLVGLVFGFRAERLLVDLLDAIKLEEPEGPPGPNPKIEGDEPPE